jgi:FkbM family methyltransferase
VDELEFHRRLYRPGLIVDVGAHDGGMTLPLAMLPGARVIAFEPLPQAFARLQSAIRAGWNGEIPAHIALHQTALGDRPGRLMLDVPVVDGVPQEQWASVAKDYAALRDADPRIEAILRTEVEVVTLDSLGLRDVTAIKLDAEGAEAEVLRGAEATLRRCQPILSVEIEERHRAGSTTEVPAWLAARGYGGFFSLDGAMRPIAAFDQARMQVASPSPASFTASDPYVFVFFFVPPDRMTAEMR